MKKNVFVPILCTIFAAGILTGCNNGGNEPKTPEYCEITFKNYDSSVLYYNTVKYGEDAIYQGETPVRPSTQAYDYTFTGWNKPLENIKEDTVFIAQYEQTLAYYTVNYWNGSSVIFTETVQRGNASHYVGDKPTKQFDERNIYKFSGWDKDTSNVRDNMDVHAVFSETPNIESITFSIDTVKVVQGYEPSIPMESWYFDQYLKDGTLDIYYKEYSVQRNYFVDCSSEEVSFTLPDTRNHGISDVLLGYVNYRGFKIPFHVQVCINCFDYKVVKRLSPSEVERDLLIDPLFQRIDSLVLLENNLCKFGNDWLNIYAYEEGDFEGGNLRIFSKNYTSCPKNIDFMYKVENNELCFSEPNFESKKTFSYNGGEYEGQWQIFAPFTFSIEENENSGYGVFNLNNTDIGNYHSVIKYQIEDNHLNIFCDTFYGRLDIVNSNQLVDLVEAD